MHPDNYKPSHPHLNPITRDQNAVLYFLIDFGSSRLVPTPPGTQPPALTDYMERDGGHWPPPEGEGMVDPYAYDVYSTGKTLESPPWVSVTTSYYLASSLTIRSSQALPWNDVPAQFAMARSVPFSWWIFCSILARNDPARRPTMRRAGQLLAILTSWIKMTRWMYWFLPRDQASVYYFPFTIRC